MKSWSIHLVLLIAVAAGCGDNIAASPPDAGCATSADCASTPGTPVCNPGTGTCVGCLVGGTDCPAHEICDPDTQRCVPECSTDTDCALTLVCDTGACVPGCRADADCPAGQTCGADRVCAAGCTPTHDCPAGQACCGSTCRDLSSDIEACGDCATPCPTFDFSHVTCMQSTCVLASCDPGHANCNADPADGCEHNELFEGTCSCTPGDVRPCYDGTAGTMGVGVCAAGTQTCGADGLGWGACVGQILPQAEICANNIDEDCDGIDDNPSDLDGDGWTRCEGDCCDSTLDGCNDPTLVNPGAFEVVGNGYDDDCDASSSDVTPQAACSSAIKFAGVTATDIARAMDLCQSTTVNPPLKSKKWGLVSATTLDAAGNPPNPLTALQNQQTAITTLFGNSITPRKSATFAGLSTGNMRDANDPGWVIPVVGTDFNRRLAFTAGGPIAAYINQHGGGLLAGQCGGVACATGSGANDSVLVRFTIRVPTNARGLAYDFRFFTSEYQSYQCTQYNDHFLALLTSTAAGIPADKNISFDALGKPMSVNNAFFQVCGGNGKMCGTCPFGTSALGGTGFDQVQGGGTEWLTTEAPVTPGETITLDLLLFDVQDGTYDTDVLLDNFRWSLATPNVNTHN